jgi:hypothetical protein
VKNNAKSSISGDEQNEICNNNTNGHTKNNCTEDNNNSKHKSSQNKNEIADLEDLHLPKVKPDTGETIPSESFWGNIFKMFF